jgi:hypothetical protein
VTRYIARWAIHAVRMNQRGGRNGRRRSSVVEVVLIGRSLQDVWYPAAAILTL